MKKQKKGSQVSTVVLDIDEDSPAEARTLAAGTLLEYGIVSASAHDVMAAIKRTAAGVAAAKLARQTIEIHSASNQSQKICLAHATLQMI